MKSFIIFQFLIGYFTTFVVSFRHPNAYDVRFACEVTKGVSIHPTIKTKIDWLKKNLENFSLRSMGEVPKYCETIDG